MENRYLDFYLKFLKSKADFRRPIKAVLDSANGVTSIILKNLKIPNSQFIVINSEIHGNFPAHGPNPLLPHATKEVRGKVLKNKADLGVVFDADGDRAVFIDNYGRGLPSYVIAYLLSLEQKPPFIADSFTFKSLETVGLEKNFYPSPVGFYFVKTKILEKQASMGVEFSNHYILKENFSSDAAILAAIEVMNILSKISHSLAQFYDLLPKANFRQFNIKTIYSKKIIKKIKRSYGRIARKIERWDGFSFNFPDWFFMVRPSNTEPVLRFFAGSKNKNILEKEVKKLKSLLS